MAAGKRLFSTSSKMVVGTIWENVSKSGNTYRTLQLQKQVRLPEGKPAYYTSFYQDDLDDLNKVIKNLSKFLNNPKEFEAPIPQVEDPYDLEKRAEIMDEIDNQRAA